MLGSWRRALFLGSPPRGADEHERFVSSITDGSYLTVDYLALTVASSAIATLGLLENSAAVIIGAMIIAPLMPVIQATAFGALTGSVRVFRRGALTLAVGTILSLVVSALLAYCLGLSHLGSEVASRTRPNLLDLGIALAAGGIGAFARRRPSIASSLAGTAIAVALMPPLCVVGIGLAAHAGDVSRGAALLFVTNLLGIALASMVMFLIGRDRRRQRSAAFFWALALTGALAVPLTASFTNLVREANLEAVLRRALTEHTATFRHATLVTAQFDWLTNPPSVTLLVRSAAVLTPHQVSLLEQFAQRATGQRFRLVIDVSQVLRVTDGSL
jgi:uncharacterized hydrophobic protein (TIGR00271 family)